MGWIYIITSPSGRSYIGQTIRPIQKRLGEHQRVSSECVAIRKAIQKYGWDNLDKDWYECPDDELNKHENWMVNLLDTLSPGGYNLKEGGGNGKPSEESNQKNRESHLGEKNHMYGKNGKNNPNYGKKESAETKQKKREATLGKTRSSETKQKQKKAKLGTNNPMYGTTGEWCPTSKRVYQYDLDGTFMNSFGSCDEAGRYLKKDGAKISECARNKNGKHKTAYKFKWSYDMNIFM
jgi:group I intron endonuclease